MNNSLKEAEDAAVDQSCSVEFSRPPLLALIGFRQRTWRKGKLLSYSDPVMYTHGTVTTHFT
jgi:hypothetical protein